MGAPAVFVDKDGTLVDDVPYNVDPERIALTRGAGPALRTLADRGFRLIVVSNQSGIGRGLFPETALDAVGGRLWSLLAEHGVRLDDFVYCPHAPSEDGGGCECRKPAPGLLRAAAERHGLDLERSWMVGDILDDVEAGRRAGCKTILVHNGNETEWSSGADRRPHHVVSDLEEASWVILDTVAPARAESVP